jgi:hypothetical protein
VNGAIAVRPMLTLTLGADSRVMDLAEAQAFLAEIKRLLEVSVRFFTWLKPPRQKWFDDCVERQFASEELPVIKSGSQERLVNTTHS